MKILTIVVRVLFGLMFVFFGVNSIHPLMQMPAPPPGLAGDFTKVFMESGYGQVVGVMEVIAGLMLLIGRFVPFALTILGAVIFNIWAFHLLMAPKEIAPAVVVTIMELFLVWRYRPAFGGLFKP